MRTPQGSFGAMLSIAILLATLVLTPSSSLAQSGQQRLRSSEKGWSFFQDTLRDRLRLSEDQYKRLLVVDEDYRQRYVALGTQPWVHQGYGQLTDAREREIKGILSSEQYAQWMEAFGGDRMPGAPPTAPPAPQP
ncbi:MAG TPA: hypothetical protein VGE21_11790 [Flavobacteriales bacterium]